jgi:branched-chain amino acid transport system ATP-binding protein
VRFGGLRALDEVDLEVEAGEILGVIGPNGAGKTTLFSVLAGSLTADAGVVSLAGRRVSGWPAHRVVRAGLVRTHQIVRPFASLTVLENVVVASLHAGGRGGGGAAAERALEVLDFVGLADRAGSATTALTLAGRKRLELARALATAPRVVLRDEVVAGLNPTEAQGLAATIRAIRDRRGAAVVMIEHVMPAVMSLSDRVLVLDHGRRIAEGTPAEVVQRAEVIEAYLGPGGAAVAR